ncbi:MAG TPA: peptide-methionine (R)-S-oxide reductase MsrB [Candidatus Eremiobacteraceae bacterium]|nr:peptide-methionine (R)-S-oxide reductase MsrB [Candidatus Eremiobacteraceae bacterium]
MNRSLFLAGLAGLAGAACAFRDPTRAAQAPNTFSVTHTDAQWHKLLTPAQYEILRAGGTEFAFSSPLDREFGKGTYDCAACALTLFSSATKFDSGTGWPSFYDHLPNAIRTTKDGTLGMERTEVHCRRCGSHLGHVFDDGPPPTGLRYCMNGLALTFVKAAR